MSDPFSPESHNQPPINPMPPVVVALFLVIAGIELVFMAGARGFVGGPGAVGWRLEAVQAYAFSGPVFDWMIANGIYPADQVMRFVTYPFVQANFSHALFVCVLLLALGKMVAEAMGSIATLVIFFGASVFGALAYAVMLNDPAPLLGGFPGVYGLIGGFTFLLWQRLGEEGGPQVRAFILIGGLLFIRLVFALLYGTDATWLADFVGFGAGFGLSILLVPGGWQKVLERLRR